MQKKEKNTGMALSGIAEFLFYWLFYMCALCLLHISIICCWCADQE